MTRTLRLMTDYFCWPLWDPEEVTHIDPSSLEISQELAEGLMAWQRLYDDTLNQEAPQDSGFESPEARAAFYEEGERLLQALKRELPGYQITYRGAPS